MFAVLSEVRQSLRVSASMARDRFAMTLLLAFAAIALLLSAVGLYGVISSIVAQRTREIGVRIALGASPRSIRTLVLGHGSRLSIVGLLLGLIIASFGVRSLAALLHGVLPGAPYRSRLLPWFSAWFAWSPPICRCVGRCG